MFNTVIVTKSTLTTYKCQTVSVSVSVQLYNNN
jgi:hypothetical protein